MPTPTVRLELHAGQFNANDAALQCERLEALPRGRRLAMRYLWREAQMLGGGYPSAWKH